VYLNENNEVKQTILQNNVVIIQPNRKARGDFAQYTANDENFILRGNPATIDDAEQGSSQGAELSFNSKNKTFSSESKTTKSNNGRIRTVYKVKKN
jgi:lipopolysaccharide export system protein LptA